MSNPFFSEEPEFDLSNLSALLNPTNGDSLTIFGEREAPCSILITRNAQAGSSLRDAEILEVTLSHSVPKETMMHMASIMFEKYIRPSLLKSMAEDPELFNTIKIKSSPPEIAPKTKLKRVSKPKNKPVENNPEE